MRSKLFVPGIRPDLFPKAYASDADAVSFDLEDAVPPARKHEARQAVSSFLAGRFFEDTGKLTIVRTNPVDSEHFDADLEALHSAQVDVINIPRVESTEQVSTAAGKLERYRTVASERAGPRLLLNIETPRGLREAGALAKAHPLVAGLQLGLGDLFEPYGIRRDVPEHVRSAMLQLAMAAAEAGVFVYDGAHPNFNDPESFLIEARMAAALGFVGKSCIHPRQIAWAHQVFTAGADEIDWARRVVAAASEASAAGQAVFVVDGQMIDPPYLRRAERLLSQADHTQPPTGQP